MYIFLRCHLLCFSKILCLFRFGNLDIRVDGSGSCRSYHINSKWPFFYLKYLTVENQTISQLFNPIPYWSTTTILRLFHLSFSFVIFFRNASSKSPLHPYVLSSPFNQRMEQVAPTWTPFNRETQKYMALGEQYRKYSLLVSSRYLHSHMRYR